MLSSRLYRTARDLTVSPRTLATMPKARNLLMVRPTHFNVDNPINPHMRASDGSLHLLNKEHAFVQWEALRQAYVDIGTPVTVIEGGEGLPDMVFCANQSFPILTRTGEKKVIQSNMANDIRHREVPYVMDALTRAGYAVCALPPRTPETLFEGMGDCLWLPGHRFLLGGYGHRTSAGIYENVAVLAEADVALFELPNPRFYHLDTCLAVLDAQSALACRAAFTADGWELLRSIFPRLIEVDVREADSPAFACNAHCPDETHVLLQSGSAGTEKSLREAGFTPVPVDTAAFIKSGGSVFCMKLMYF